MYKRKSNSFCITINPKFVEEESSPEEYIYVWAYHIRIENRSDESAWLKKRFWIVTDALGNTHEVRGDSTFQKDPLLKPGEIFEYTSGIPLTTPSGIMQGAYKLETEKGEIIDVLIPTFSLDSPYENCSIH